MNLDSVFSKLIIGQTTYTSTNLSVNLLITRLQKKYSFNQSQEGLNTCLQEMNSFFEKYKTIVAKDVEILSKI